MSVVMGTQALSKRFPGVTALDGVEIELREREVLGLIGQNGSGKSTLLKILGGVEQPDGGTVTVRGRPTRLAGVAHANRLGIGLVFQEQSLVPGLTVAENIFLGKPTRATRGGVVRWRALRREAQRQLDKVASPVSPSARVDELDFASRQMVELAKALALEELAAAAPVVLLDEPTSVLGADEVHALFDQVRRLRERASVVFVSHRLDEVLAISDRVYVLSDGRCVAERTPAQADADELYRLMVGAERAQDYYLSAKRTQVDEQPVRLRVDGLAVRGQCRDVSFTVRAGEVLGLAGVVGSGREAICRALAGAIPVTAGRLELDERTMSLRSPAAAVEAGVGFVPAERKVEGMLRGRSVHDNLFVSAGRKLRRGPFIDRRRESTVAQDLVGRLHVKTRSAQTRIDDLSGGNQQKVVLGRWLATGRLKVLVLDHPTRGLDLQAKSDVYELIRALTAQGVAIVLISDTLEETLGLSDRLLVLRDGQVTGRFDDLASSPPAKEHLVELMV